MLYYREMVNIMKIYCFLGIKNSLFFKQNLMFLMENHNNAEVFAAASISNNVYNAAELLIPFSGDVLYRFLEIQTVLKSRFGHYNKYSFAL